MKYKWGSILVVYLMCYQIISGTYKIPIQSEGAILIEASTNTVLYSKNAHEKLYPASITKILTALICAEDMEQNTIVKKTSNAVNEVPKDSSHIGLAIGDTYTRDPGLYGLLLGSDNFIAYDLAIKHSGSIQNFAKVMNQKARNLGAVNSNFMNPHGYHNVNHYTTPYDMAQIAKGAFSNDKVTQIAGTRNYTIKLNNGNKQLAIKNSSRLLDPNSPYYNPNVIATKTGWHDDAGQTIVAKAKYGELELIAVTMNTRTPNQYKDINALFEYGSKNFAIDTSSGQSVLKNKTYSSFGEPFVNYARQQGWEISKGKNYQEPINYSELLDILGYLFGRDNVKTVLQNQYTKAPEQHMKRKDIAYILQHLLKNQGVTPTIYHPNPYIPDIEELEGKYQEAIKYTTSTQLLGNKDRRFEPESTLTYEQALCMAYRIETTCVNVKSR